MDSNTISKLIRDEIWPSLRQQGFSRFEGRSAFRYRGEYIYVVNFQSFNSDLAGKLGCTTFSFTLNLGVYVTGSLDDRRIRNDDAGCLKPYQYECAFRVKLQKRSLVDGFERRDIFSINPDGTTTAACISESRALLVEVAPEWFDLFNDRKQLLFWLETDGGVPLHSPHLQNGPSAGKGSVNLHKSISTIKLLQHRENPTAATAQVLIDEAEKLFGAYLNLPQTISSAAIDKGQVEYLNHLLEAHQENLGSPQFTTDSDYRVGIKQHIWPVLRDRGFSEFKTRVAFRPIGQAVQVIEITPITRVDKKLAKPGERAFQIQLGLFWPLLPVGRFGAAGKSIKMSDCQITTWLLSDEASAPSIQVAVDCLKGRGFPWLHLFESAESALAVLRKTDWEIFSLIPLTRNIGASGSAKRLMLLAFFAFLCHRHEESTQYLEQAQDAIESHLPLHLQRNARVWFHNLQSVVSG